MKGRLSLTVENLKALHEIGHFLAYLIGIIDYSRGSEEEFYNQVKGCIFITTEEILFSSDSSYYRWGYIRELTLAGGCILSRYYFLRTPIKKSKILHLFNRGGGVSDLNQLMWTVDNDRLFEIGKKLITIFKEKGLRRDFTNLATRLRENKFIDGPEIMEISKGLYEKLKRERN